MVTDYWILSSTSEMSLLKDVKHHIEGGWEPIGGVSMVMETVEIPGEKPKQHPYFAQTMIQRSKPWTMGPSRAAPTFPPWTPDLLTPC